jgi:hypothetical protein
MADTGATRVESFPAGIAGAGLGEVERQIPMGEPPPCRRTPSYRSSAGRTHA